MLTSLVRAVDSSWKVQVYSLAVSLCCAPRRNTLLSQCFCPPKSFFDHISLNYPAGKPDEMLGSYLVTS